MALDTCLDAAGNKFGGVTSGLAGFGDIVTDIRSKTATVQKCWSYTGLIGDWLVLVRANQPDGGIREFTVNSRALTIVSHADGGGLVSGGPAVSPVFTTLPPTGNNFMMGFLG